MAKTLIGLITDYVRRNPRTSAMVAFNLGLYAAMAATKGVKRSDLKKLPAKLVELVPSIKDLTDFLPAVERKPTARRKAGRKVKATAGRSPRRKAA